MQCFFMSIASIVLEVRLKKINPVPQSCCAHLFFGARLIQQGLNFFACLIYFPVFYELACQNIQEKM